MPRSAASPTAPTGVSPDARSWRRSPRERSPKRGSKASAAFNESSVISRYGRMSPPRERRNRSGARSTGRCGAPAATAGLNAIVDGLRGNDLSHEQLGRWGALFNQGVDRMRRLVCEDYDGFSPHDGRRADERAHHSRRATSIAAGSDQGHCRRRVSETSATGRCGRNYEPGRAPQLTGSASRQSRSSKLLDNRESHTVHASARETEMYLAVVLAAVGGLRGGQTGE